MKKFFPFLSILLLSGALFVGCGETAETTEEVPAQEEVMAPAEEAVSEMDAAMDSIESVADSVMEEAGEEQ